MAVYRYNDHDEFTMMICRLVKYGGYIKLGGYDIDVALLLWVIV